MDNCMEHVEFSYCFHDQDDGTKHEVRSSKQKECISADDFLKILKYIVKPNLGLIFADLSEASLGEIQGGYPSGNPVDREWFYEKQQSTVNALELFKSSLKASLNLLSYSSNLSLSNSPSSDNLLILFFNLFKVF